MKSFRHQKPIRWLAIILCVLGFNTRTVKAEAFVDFNFDQADVRVLIKLAGEMTGKRFVVDEGVSGRVTVITPSQIPLSEVYPLFLSVLEGAGYTVVDRGSVHHVLASAESTVPGAPIFGVENELPDRGGLVTKVFQIEHIRAGDLKAALTPMVRGGEQGALEAFESTNHLIITDSVENLKRMENLIQELDQPGLRRSVELIELEFADATELSVQLNKALSGMQSASSQFSRQVRQVAEGRGESIASSVVAIPQANRLLLSGEPDQIAELKRIIEELDIESESGAGDLHVLFLKYMNAEEAATNLTDLLAKSIGDGSEVRIAIEPNVSNNALLIKASPRDFSLVRDLVNEMDQVPQQVLVEVLIAEVSSGDQLDLGVEWSTIEVPENGKTTFIGRSRPDSQDFISDLASDFFFPQGLNIALAKGTFEDASGNIVPSIPILIRALAENRDVKILSNVPLWAQNNKPASVSIVDNIPLLSSTIQGGSGTSRDVIQNIERVDVGIKLTLTPHINPQQEISLELNPSIEAIVDPGPVGSFTPTIARRDVTTTVTIPNKSTIIISGLMREDTVDTVSKVPFLGDIPFLGALFRSTSKQSIINNLLIFVTPHIVTDVREAQKMVEELTLRTGLGSAVDPILNPPLEQLRLEADNGEE